MKALKGLEGLSEVKYNDDREAFTATADPKKFPLPDAILKVVKGAGDNYSLDEFAFDQSIGDLVKKDGELRFVPAGTDKGFLVVKATFEGKPKEDPYDTLTKLYGEGVTKIVLDGAMTEEKKDDKTILKVAVLGVKKHEEPKKETPKEEPRK